MPFLLIPFLAAHALQGGSLVPPKTRDELASLLASVGYPAQPTDPKGAELRIGRGEDAAVVMPYNGFDGIRVRAQIDAPKDVEPDAVPTFPPAGGGGFDFVAQPHLGKTVDVGQSFILKRMADADALRAALDRFFANANAVAQKVAGKAPATPRLDWGHARFDDATVVRVADIESLSRVAAVRGWVSLDAKPGVTLGNLRRHMEAFARQG